MYRTSNEAIAFQGGSPLAKGLVKIFKDATASKLEHMKYGRNGVSKFIDHFKETFPKQFSALVKSTTGITVKEVQFAASFDCGYACIMNFGDKYGINAHKFIEEYSGMGSGEWLDQILEDHDLRVTTASELKAVVDSLNRTTGFYKKMNIGKSGKIGLSMTLYFDPWAAFFSEEILGPNVTPFCEEEIAAIVIHEIGHMHTALEHCLDGLYRLDATRYAADHFNRNATAQEKLKFYKTCELPPGIEDKINATIDQEEPGTITDRSVATSIGGIFVDLLFSWLYILWIPFSICKEIVRRSLKGLADYTANDPSRTDLMYGDDNLRFCERLADQFVNRHGLGSYLTTGLSKMDHWYAGSKALAYDRTSGFLWNYKTAIWVMWNLISGSKYIRDTHDETFVRAQRLLSDTLIAFKKQSMPTNMLNFYIAEYERIAKFIKSADAVDKTPIWAEQIRNVIGYIVKTPFALLFTGRQGSEQRKMVGKIESLINNDLYYRSAKLRQLLKK